MTRTNHRGYHVASAGATVLLFSLLLLVLNVVDVSAQRRKPSTVGKTKGKTERKATAKTTAKSKSAKSKGATAKGATAKETKSKSAKSKSARSAESKSKATRSRGSTTTVSERRDSRRDNRGDPQLYEPEDELIVVDPAAETIMRVTQGDPTYDKAPLRNFMPTSLADQRLLGRQEREVARIPARPYPDVGDRFPHAAPLYADLRLGLYSTVAFNAGIVGSSWPYDYGVGLDATTTKGSEDHASVRGVIISAEGGYVIDNGYGIFSGGHMGGGGDYRARTYTLYADPQTPERSYSGWGMFLSSDNTYLDNGFHLRGGYRALTLNDNDGNARRETSIEGKGGIETKWIGLHAGVDAELQLATYDGTRLPYGSLRAGLTYKSRGFSLFGGAALSAADNSDGTSATRIAPQVRLTITPLSGVVLLAELKGGVHGASLRDMLEVNPYATTEASHLLRHEDETMGVQGGLRIDAGEDVGLHFYGGHSLYKDYLFFALPESGRFAPRYAAARVDQVGGDFTLGIDRRNRLTGEVRFAESMLDSSNTQVPYVPRWYVSTTYSHTMIPTPLTIIVGGKYIGSRENGAASLQDGVMLVSLEGRYKIISNLEATLSFSNLLNRGYEVWQGYPERGIYAAIGATFRH